MPEPQPRDLFMAPDEDEEDVVTLTSGVTLTSDVTLTGGSGVPLSDFNFIPDNPSRIRFDPPLVGVTAPVSTDSWDPPVSPRQAWLRTIQNEGSPVRRINFEPAPNSVSPRPDRQPISPGFTNEDVREWANGRLCSIPPGRERQIIEGLARIIVREVLR